MPQQSDCYKHLARNTQGLPVFQVGCKLGVIFKLPSVEDLVSKTYVLRQSLGNLKEVLTCLTGSSNRTLADEIISVIESAPHNKASIVSESESVKNPK